MMTADAVKVYAFNVNDDGTLGAGHNNEDNPSKEVDRRTRKYMEAHGEKDYSTALYKVLAADPDLKARYTKVGP